MTEITQADREASVAIRCALYRAVAGIPSYPQGIVEPYLARHREHAEQATVAKIVAWLRNRKEMTERYIDYVETAQAADCIEAGEWK